jgi:hypothetical protein
MKAVTESIAAGIRDAVKGWNAFWFTPTDPATLCLLRILCGGMLFYTHLVWTLDLEAFFGRDPWLSRDAVDAFASTRFGNQGTFFWSHLNWIDSSALLWAAHVAALLVFACFTLGLFTRVTSILAFLLCVSYANRVPGALFGLDQANAMLSMYLMLGPAGACYSLDRLLRRRRSAGVDGHSPSTSANVALRLMQVHLCVVYLFAGLAKFRGEMWPAGVAMWGAVANLEYQSLNMTWLSRWPRLVNLLTHVTLGWELFYCVLVWPKRLRPYIVALAVPLHLGIALFLGMVTFGTAMLFANLAFLSPEFVRGVLERNREGRGRAGQGGPGGGPPGASRANPIRPTRRRTASSGR